MKNWLNSKMKNTKIRIAWDIFKAYVLVLTILLLLLWMDFTKVPQFIYNQF